MPEIQHIHPILVHFPIVLMYALVVIDLAALAHRNAVTTRSGVGTISTFAAVGAGLFAVCTCVLRRHGSRPRGGRRLQQRDSGNP
ncbi:DUF2231 domain-containing protein [Mesorhizobium atlanticum]